MNRIYVMQLVRSFQCGLLTRREFMARATVALGSAASASLLLSACAPTPSTPPPVLEEPSGAAPEAEAAVEGVATESVTYEDADGETLMGFLARPEGSESAPGVVVIQEWWGLNEHIRDVARRFAQEGFVALAPDLYHGQVTTEPNEARKLVMELDMEEAVREIQRAVTFLQEQAYVAGEKVGVVGFCMGGGLTLQTARVEPAVGAAVAFYGSPLQPSQAQEVQAPVLGLYGENDQGIPVASVEQMGQALTEAGIPNEMHVYEGADHAFFNNTRESYHAEAAQDAWTRTLAWFREYLPA